VATAFECRCRRIRFGRFWSKASAFGLAPNKSPRATSARRFSTTLSVRASMTLTVSLPALATNRMASIRRQRQSRGNANRPGFRGGLCLSPGQ